MKNHRKKYVILFVAGLLSAFLLQGAGTLLEGVVSRVAKETAPESLKAKKKIEAISDLIDQEFLFEVDKNELTEGMYAGLVSGLSDPYSEYYTEEAYRSISESHEGHYQGIGVVMLQDKTTGRILVGYCYEESPAKKAGVLEGDMIYQIGEERVSNWDLQDVANAIKENGSDEVTLTLYREKTQEYLEVTIQKEEIEIPVVDAKMLESKVGYLAIHQFTAVTAEQFEESYQKLLDEGMERLIIDLRDNPGGLLNGVCDTLNLFMPEGLLVYTEDKEGKRKEYVSEGENPIAIPLVVLVNENSASASEIFAGAVKDHGVGILVGTTTYGKGIVQKTFSLADGSVVKLTVSSYYTPNGKNIHGTGIEPDVIVEQPEGEEEDLQLKTAMEKVLE